MADNAPPPPPPPPHGSNAKSAGLPPGNYDIFIIPPHSSGSGFLYLPSLQVQRNSFLAGVVSTLVAVGIWATLVPALKHSFSAISSGGGAGVTLLVGIVGVAAWAFGKTQGEQTYSQGPPPGRARDDGARSSTHGQRSYGAYYDQAPPPPQPEYRAPPPPHPETPKSSTKQASDAWEKAREETKKREDARKRAEELRKMREESQKKKEDTEKQTKAAAEKLRWEQSKAREKEAHEREAREKIAKDKVEKEKAAASTPSPEKRYEHPTAKSYASNDASSYAYRPYDKPDKTKNPLGSSASSYSESSYAPSASTARTTPPPPEHRGPYTTSDPDKILLKAVYQYTSAFQSPVSQLINNTSSVTDGLILRITTEGLFIDDDVRCVPQREWDVKAWGLKLVESGEMKPLQVLRASVRDLEGKRYVFVIPADQGWKVDVGLARLRKGPLVRSLGMNGIKAPEMKKLLGDLGFVE